MKNKLIFILLAVGGLMTSCQKEQAAVEEVKAFMLSDTMMKRIELASVGTEPIRSELTLVGKIMADENRVIKVYPLVGGMSSRSMSNWEIMSEKGKYWRPFAQAKWLILNDK